MGRGAGAKRPELKVYTDPEHVDADFKFQGEYVGEIARPDGGKARLGAQVRALGDGRFRTMFFAGGLPGDGWDGKTIIQKAPSTDSIRPPMPSSRAIRSSSTRSTRARSTAGRSTARPTPGAKFQLTRVDRRSPTLGAKPPAGAIVLFDGTTRRVAKDASMTPQKLLGPGRPPGGSSRTSRSTWSS